MESKPTPLDTALSQARTPRRVAVAAAAIALAVSGCATAARADDGKRGVRQPAAAASSGGSTLPGVAAGAHLPPSWPITKKGLPPKSCNPGDPIDRQVPQEVEGHSAAVIDSRCEPPHEQNFTKAHTRPTRTSPVIARVFDGQLVKLECKTTGQALGDSRHSRVRNDEWFIIAFPELEGGNRPLRGFVAGANMGQLAVGPEVPDCSAASTTAPAPSHEPPLGLPPTTLVPPPSTAPSPTTTPSPSRVRVPTTTPSPSPVCPEENMHKKCCRN